MSDDRGGVCGIVLAAGAGTRYGMPKALVTPPDGVPWIRRAVEALLAGGCAPVFVALGAAHEVARGLVPTTDARVVIVPVPDWASGLSASVRAALAAADEAGSLAAVLIPVDTPGLPAEAVARVAAGADGSALRRAVYGDAPGHPVVIGHRHWAALARDLRGGGGGGRVGGRGGDRGAGAYLEAHGAVRVECGDLWDGMDVDLPELRT